MSHACDVVSQNKGGVEVKRILFFVAAATLLLPRQSSATGTVSVVLHPPEVFSRSTGAAGPVVRSFTVPSAAGSFTLRVTNGNGIGEEGVSSAVIKVNGEAVVSTSDLNQRVTAIERPLTNLVSGANTLEVEVRSIPSSYLTVSIEGMYLLDVTITTPLAGTVVPSSGATIQGTFAAYTADVGIAVNGVPAALAGGSFVATDVPLEAGMNALTAVITTIDGLRDQDEIAVTSVELQPALTLTARPASGAAPLQVTFNPSVASFAPTEYRYDFDGDGVVDLAQSGDAPVSHTFAETGVYQSVVLAVDASGVEYAAQQTVVVEDAAAVDAVLSGRWRSLSTALQQQDAEGALAAILPERQEEYREVFAALQTRLPAIMESLPAPQLLSAKGHVAQYRVTREQMWEGEQRTITYYLWFVRDADGIWRLDAF